MRCISITEKAKQYHKKMFPGYESKFLETDPEFIERFDCEPQLVSHAAANMRIGNDKAFLIKVIS